MSVSTLLEQFPLLADAPEGVKRLRELILELAVRGKLVPQDPNDEPASELLKRIQAEKAKLVAEGKIKKDKPLPEIGEDEKPFELPEGWEWVRMGGLVDPLRTITYGVLKPGNNDPGGVVLVKTENVFYNRVVTEFSSRISKDLDDQYKRTKLLGGEILLTLVGSIGRCAVAPSSLAGANLSRSVGMIVPFHELHSRYLVNVLTALINEAYIASNCAGTAQTVLNVGTVNEFVVPIPPLAEQHRIVTKVDKLMALCDRLEAQQADAASAHATLVKTLLDTLTQSHSAADFTANWQRIAPHFDTLFTTEASLSALKQTLLQLAVMGKLVPQDPNDVPVEGKLGDYVEFLNGYAFKSEWFTKSGVRLLRNANVGHGQCDWRDTAFIPMDRIDEFSRFQLGAGDLVLSLDRPIINTGLKIARVSEQDLPCLLLQRVAKVIPRNDSVCADYLHIWFNSPQFISTIDPGRSNGVPHISTKQVGAIPFIRYGTAEQHRIVAKVDELMALCDQLAARLKAARELAAHYASAATEAVLEAA